MLTKYVLQEMPLLVSLFFILGVFIIYEILFDGIKSVLSIRKIEIESNILKAQLGIMYLFILLFGLQTLVVNQETTWIFINFQIIALIFCAVFLDAPVNYPVFIPIVLIFMIFNSAIFYWESWCFALTLFAFYFSLKYIKKKRANSFPFIYYILDGLLFGVILWTLARIKFSLDVTTIFRQVSYLIVFEIFVYSYIGFFVRDIRVKHTLYEFAHLDALTHVKNFAAFDNDIHALFNQYQSNKIDVAMIMFDIDHFKSINDHYGHLIGDKVLQQVADITQTVLAANDNNIRFYRTGGEEFNIILPSYKLTEIDSITQEVFSAINNSQFCINNQTVDVSVSVGSSEIRDSDLTSDEFYSRVDEALYQSKRNGRMRITKS
ncbi:GGDEF domain-containing protein [Companilactobacillus sp. HBUAS56275]|uniref:GGDEF domain-containing protein n=1 Tax=Candidatus Companilactobacillus pullicola TaxID=2838523 RepID=A0A9D2CPM6_9LACO|nr:GGDEF domain-containing protein [Candidatus Companilactobacillus pullicola]